MILSSNVPVWIGDYVGLPWCIKGRDHNGVDCWGLVYLVYLEHFGVQLPSYADAYDDVKSWRQISRLITGETKAPWVEVYQPIFGDVVVLRIETHPWHCGLVLQPGVFLHCEHGIGQVIVDYYDDSSLGKRWCRRVNGFYRHTAMV